MIVHFMHGLTLVHATQIEPTQDGPLPTVIMVGAAIFVFQHMHWNGHADRWEARYQVARPFLMPPLASGRDLSQQVIEG